MTKRLHHVAPLQLGIVLAVLYGLFTLLFVPFGLMAVFLIPRTGDTASNVAPIALAIGVIMFPIFYAIFGFIGGVIGAAVYNLIAKWTGGIEFTFVDPPLAHPPGLPV